MAIWPICYCVTGTPLRLWFTDLDGRTCGLEYMAAFFRRTAR